MSEKRFRRKRDFSKTPEPRGGRRASGGNRFVIQEHDATALHYDFRLEIDGTLKSWAVPKGLSTDPGDRRLAIRTEDHPVAYADFEGNIPEGQYGAGPVLIWDRGTFENVTRKDGTAVAASKALADGHLLFRLHGEKLRGGYALQRMEDDGSGERWLLVKMRDEEADARRNPVSTQPESVVSHRTIEEIAGEARGDARSADKISSRK